MIPDMKETPIPVGFMLQAPATVAHDVAAVLSRMGRAALVSAEGSVRTMDVFNCLLTMQRTSNPESYIINERGDTIIWVTTWDSVRLAGFFDLIVQGKVSGLVANQKEIESLRIMSSTLRSIHHDKYN